MHLIIQKLLNSKLYIQPWVIAKEHYTNSDSLKCYYKAMKLNSRYYLAYY